MASNTQIYSATYSNVPVFEFVTSEGPIMRRKLDSWINATHILKIAKFPKAKRTRILEKDVQTGIHEKVQGGYGKYQGTYVPLNLGEKIARNFDVYDMLSPIFEFNYIEGKTETPPPAPKHNHASAINVAKRQNLDNKKKSTTPLAGEPPKKRGRPKRVALQRGSSPRQHLEVSLLAGPSLGTFEPATRQDTEPDRLIISNLKNEDLKLVESDDDEKLNGHLISHNEELFTSKELFGASRESFEKIIYQQKNQSMQSYDGNSIINIYPNDQIYHDYFQSLLLYFVEDSKIRPQEIPEKLLNPPQPIGKININQSIDNDGNTIFHWACSMAQTIMVEFLLTTFQINPNIKNNKGETPLMFLINFSNAYQLKTFPMIIELLNDLILAVDKTNKTVLHHIALNAKNKERCARYYMEILFDKIMTIDDAMYKFINHQDNDGNTGFHISASLLNKKCIKVFISYHRYIDFGLKNGLGFTVDEYLANHNYVLRLEEENGDHAPSEFSSFESQLYNSKLAINLQNTTSNLITEKLGELAFYIDKELSKKDEEILNLFKILKDRNLTKLQTQREIHSIFKLDHMITQEEDTELINLQKDKLIQEEVYRLINDLSFQLLLKREELNGVVNQWREIKEKQHYNQLQKISSLEAEKATTTNQDQFNLSIELNNEIIKRRILTSKLTQKQVDISPDEYKENDSATNSRLDKYCKLISICCGMSVNEVENSLDLIEQSLTKSK